MKKDIKIGDKIVPMKATALTPYKYKNEFGRDIFRDAELLKDVDKFDSVVICRIAYSMTDAGEPFESWLDGFEILDFVKALPEILSLWNGSQMQNSTPKKG